jgi:hypothetical protein
MSIATCGLLINDSTPTTSQDKLFFRKKIEYMALFDLLKLKVT